jgi:hypothetical protein
MLASGLLMEASLVGAGRADKRVFRLAGLSKTQAVRQAPANCSSIQTRKRVMLSLSSRFAGVSR